GTRQLPDRWQRLARRPITSHHLGGDLVDDLLVHRRAVADRQEQSGVDLCILHIHSIPTKFCAVKPSGHSAGKPPSDNHRQKTSGADFRLSWTCGTDGSGGCSSNEMPSITSGGKRSTASGKRRLFG